jgi:curved DNA-binding protein
MEYKDYYKILNVERSATEDAIKKSYRRLARKYHPDVSKEANAEEKFKDVQEAYEVLKDKEKRTAYDQLGSNWRQGQEFRPPPGWGQGAGTHFNTAGDFDEAEMGGFSDFFANIFGQGQSAGGRVHRGSRGHAFRQRGSDQRAQIVISLEDAYHGTTRQLQLQIPEMDAAGNVHQKTKTLKVNVTAGTADGQQLRLSGQGGPGAGGGPAGDLYLEINIQPHRYFSMQGADIYLTLPVTPWEAALGAEIKVPTLGGMVGLKIAPGTQAGQKLRLKSRGMPTKPTAGDQYAVVQIQTPPATTAEQREFYQKMSQEMPFNPRKDWVG